MTEDFRSCLASVKGRDAYGLDQEILLMQGRCKRLLRVLCSNMEENPAPYTRGQEATVLSAVVQLRDKGVCLRQSIMEVSIMIMKETETLEQGT